MNMEMRGFVAWRGNVWSQHQPTCQSEPDVDISIHPACSVALRGCCRAVRQVRVWMHSLRDSCEGHHQWIMRRQKHLKGHVVWREEGKGQLPSLFERHPARSWVGTLNTMSAEIERHKVAWSFSPLSQTFFVTGRLHYYGKSRTLACAAVQCRITGRSVRVCGSYVSAK